MIIVVLTLSLNPICNSCSFLSFCFTLTIVLNSMERLDNDIMAYIATYMHNAF